MRYPAFVKNIWKNAGIVAIMLAVAFLFVMVAPQSGVGPPNQAQSFDNAAITLVINYQGRLLNPTTGAPLNGTFTRFICRQCKNGHKTRVPTPGHPFGLLDNELA